MAQVEGPLRVRVESYDPGSACTGTSTISLDGLEVVVHYTTPETLQEDTVSDPVTGAPLASQGFWGAIFTPGGIRENGDRYGPKWIGGNNPPDGANGGPNPDYDPDGYQYLIEVGGDGQVRLFDPIFCATGRNATGGWLGTGDHWTNDHDDGGGENRGPISVRFTLYNTNGTPYTTSDDYQVGSTWSHNPGESTLGDFSGSYGTPQNASDANRQDCSTDPAHNDWVLPSGWSSLSAGTYRLNVNTNLGLNDNLGAENLFSIWVGGSGTARVYGAGRMAAYTNLDDFGGWAAGVLLRPDRSGPRGQDDGDHALRPG